MLVNAVSARSGGGVTYALEQLTALARQPGLALTVLAPRPVARALAERAPGVAVESVRTLPVPARVLWEQTVLARRARGFDVVYGIGNFALLLSGTAQVVTFQNPNHFGGMGREVNRTYSTVAHRARIGIEAVLARRSVRRAEVAIAISEHLREAMIETIPGAEPRLVPSAPPVHDLPADPNGNHRTRRATPDRYVLTVANDYSHKDWDGLIAAFTRSDELPPLVLVGAPRSARRAEALRRRLGAAAGRRVVMWGPELDRRELDALYRGAVAYVSHSWLEAFALTPYEAFARGVPVVVSDIPSHREVCGDRAEYYDPARPEELTAAVERAGAAPSPDPWLPDRTWDDVAREVADALVAAAERRPRSSQA